MHDFKVCVSTVRNAGGQEDSMPAPDIIDMIIRSKYCIISSLYKLVIFICMVDERYGYFIFENIIVVMLIFIDFYILSMLPDDQLYNSVSIASM